MQSGVVVQYDEEKGYGFVRSAAYGSEDVFVHASKVVGRGTLRPGQKVRFEAEPSPKGPRATRVEPGRMGLSPARTAGLGLGAILLVATIALAYYERLPPEAAWIAAINPVTFAAFALDKARAIRGGRRVPERVLLGLSLLGGSPAAAAAMTTLRHKTRKVAFLVPFAAIVLLQVAALAWWVARP